MSKNRTHEQIRAEIEKHRKYGATRKIKLLEMELAELDPPMDIPYTSTNPDLDVPSTCMEEIAYNAYINGQPWSEIEEITGLKRPWFAVKRWAEKNGKPYPKP